MEELFLYLSSIRPLSPECIAYLSEIVKTKKIRKGEILLDIGQVNRHLYFILSGWLHCYYFVKKKPVSDWFFSRNEAVVSIGSFYLQVPSEDCIVAMEDCELLYIPRDKHTYLKETFPEFAYIASELLEKYLMEFHGHARLIRKHTGYERFKRVLEKMPHLFLYVPVALLASWMGMEPETLSRFRGRKN